MKIHIIKQVEKILAYKFKDTDLLDCALTHDSYDSTKFPFGNERLEFVGDRVLGICISSMLYENFSNAPEGELAKRMNRLVKKSSCADVASYLGLGSFIIMAKSEKQSGGQKKDSILADCMEAVIGAMYIDGGYDVAYGFVQPLWQPLLEQDIDIPVDNKSALQEWSLHRAFGLPIYEVISQSGADHEPVFITKVAIDKAGVNAVGEGKSKKISQQNAAKALLLIVEKMN